MSVTKNLRDEPLELWAGVECTVNRVGDAYFDQLEVGGHARRPGDLDLFAALGIRTLRYPLLWERTQPDPGTTPDWTWADERLRRLRELGIRPVLGLLHHGSGPRHTSLVDPDFADGLQAYAAAVARRFPWVDCYTPVNEPLTTARFSGLYGLWYPHGQAMSVFARALIHQCRGVVLAMARIREVNPRAKLIQTEDLGKISSTRRLAYQADFENQRRWLTWDLLSGRVDRHHPLWKPLVGGGELKERELLWFTEHPCPPDVIGINYYVTSERFLDERLERYPPHTHGGNRRHRYADVEAVRVCAGGLAGVGMMLREAWERYHLPLAITEAHLGCTRDEQMRWLWEVWNSAHHQREKGMDVRAVTAWSLLGSFDWNSLLTRSLGHYEPGVFDLRSPKPRPTGLAGLVESLARGNTPRHPVLDTPGWWRRPQRLLYPPVRRSARNYAERPRARNESSKETQPILITGASGTLGGAFARCCADRGLAYRLVSRQEMDSADEESVASVLATYKPWAVINAARYVRVDEAESEPVLCFRENVAGPANLAQACALRGVALLTFSSDLVFDGQKSMPYRESDNVNPLNVFGRSKAHAENRVLEMFPQALVVRTGELFGPWDDDDFITVALRNLAQGQTFMAAEDRVVSPAYLPDLVNASLDLLMDRAQGIWHLNNQGAVSSAALVRRAAALAQVNSARLQSCTIQELVLPAQRPLYSVLGSERGLFLPPLEEALTRYVRESPHGFVA